MDTFAPVLATLRVNQWGLSRPTSFTGYLKAHGLRKVDTAAAISVDALERLTPSLREAQAMVLRLGAATDGPGTQFAVVTTPGRLHDFFIEDKNLPDGPTTEYTPEVPEELLLPYAILRKPTEGALVNLSFASGIIGFALGLDPPHSLPIPATGASTYPFTVTLHPEFPQELPHNNGQVEIDALFIGRRQGRDCLFVMEAKSTRECSLAKHKLVYPILALAEKVPAKMEIVPVYMRVRVTRRVVTYAITECRFPDPRRGRACISKLTPVACHKVLLRLPQIQ